MDTFAQFRQKMNSAVLTVCTLTLMRRVSVYMTILYRVSVNNNIILLVSSSLFPRPVSVRVMYGNALI